MIAGPRLKVELVDIKEDLAGNKLSRIDWPHVQISIIGTTTTEYPLTPRTAIELGEHLIALAKGDDPPPFEIQTICGLFNG